MEDGKFESTEEGSAQGSVMSPMLANIYMHNVLTLWFKFVVKKTLKGDCFLVNFADDFVAGFQYKIRSRVVLFSPEREDGTIQS